MRTVNIHEAKTHFSKLIEAVSHGEEIIVARAGKPTAKIVPIAAQPPKRKPGLLKGKIHIPSAFYDPKLDEKIRKLFEREYYLPKQ